MTRIHNNQDGDVTSQTRFASARRKKKTKTIVNRRKRNSSEKRKFHPRRERRCPKPGKNSRRKRKNDKRKAPWGIAGHSDPWKPLLSGGRGGNLDWGRLVVVWGKE